MIKRRRFAKLPLQAQFYPMPGAAFIQDDKNRLSLLGAQANGVASLKPGKTKIKSCLLINRSYFFSAKTFRK